MSVYIKGMEMPTEGTVIAIYRLKGKFYASMHRGELCPLVPVPDHGRLADLDAVMLDGGPYEYDEWCKWALEQYLNAPTVIPADKEGE